MRLIAEYFKDHKIQYESFIEECPNCGRNVSPYLIENRGTYDENYKMPVRFFVLQCNRNECRKYYLVEIALQEGFANDWKIIVDHKVYPNQFKQFEDEEIRGFSPKFIEIYNQAKMSEEMRLTEISGPGYRKALEFLVKDYIIFSSIEAGESKEDEVRKSKSVVQLIKDHIDNEKIVKAAEKAFWIGNDSTHYEKEWMDLDIQDLKILIEIVIYHIKLERQMKYYEEKMKRHN